KPLKTKVLKGEEVFHESAVKAAMNSSYTPGVQNGQPIKVWMTIPYKFSLK
ncbi:MAG: energy transducer TonB, partial [Rhizobacter sp.]|nr:energy transducer TonB [Chlorobiales bacterium]